MTPRRAAVLTAVGVVLLAGCTDGTRAGAGSTTPTASSAAASPGPLAADPDDAGVTPRTTALFRLAVSDAGVPGLVFQDPTDPSVLTDTRIGVGLDPAAAPVTPVDVESGNEIGSPVVGDDGSLTALAVLNGDQAFGLHVLRLAADGSQTATRVPDAGIGTLGYATTDGVADDGTTAVVASTDRSTDDPSAVDRVVVTTIDLAAARVTGRATADLGTDGPVDPRAVRIGPDGSVTVLVAPAPDATTTTGASLVRFGPGGADPQVVELDPTSRFDTSQLDLTADGTAVVSLQLAGSRLSTRVLTVAPGSDEVVPVADLADTAVAALVTGPAGWAHLQVTRYTDGRDAVLVLPLHLPDGETADPVELCADRADESGSGDPGGGEPDAVLGLARSGPGSTLLAWANCGPQGGRLVVLTPR